MQTADSARSAHAAGRPAASGWDCPARGWRAHRARGARAIRRRRRAGRRGRRLEGSGRLRPAAPGSVRSPRPRRASPRWAAARRVRRAGGARGPGPGGRARGRSRGRGDRKPYRAGALGGGQGERGPEWAGGGEGLRTHLQVRLGPDGRRHSGRGWRGRGRRVGKGSGGRQVSFAIYVAEERARGEGGRPGRLGAGPPPLPGRAAGLGRPPHPGLAGPEGGGSVGARADRNAL